MLLCLLQLGSGSEEPKKKKKNPIVWLHANTDFLFATLRPAMPDAVCSVSTVIILSHHVILMGTECWRGSCQNTGVAVPAGAWSELPASPELCSHGCQHGLKSSVCYEEGRNKAALRVSIDCVSCDGFWHILPSSFAYENKTCKWAALTWNLIIFHTYQWNLSLSKY